MPRMPRYLALSLMLLGKFAFAETGFGSVEGTVTDQESGEPLPLVEVSVFQNGQEQGFATTDFNGKYLVSSLASGEYIVQSDFAGYATFLQTEVVVSSGVSTSLPIALSPLMGMLSEQPASAPVPHPVPLLSLAAQCTLALMMLAVALRRV